MIGCALLLSERVHGTMPAPNRLATTTAIVTGIAVAQKIHCPSSSSRISLTFIPKMLDMVLIGKKIMVTMVKT
jgi:hypothetical protein